MTTLVTITHLAALANLLRAALLAGAALLGSGLAHAQAQPRGLVAAQSPAAADKAALLQGVGPVPLPSAPDFLCTTLGISEQPAIILTGRAEPEKDYQLIALSSSRLGQGKLLVFGSAAYLRRPLVQDAQVQRLLANALRWGSRARRPRVQVWGGDEALAAWLVSKKAQLVGDAAAPAATADILVVAKELTDTVQLRRIGQFVRRGGTLLYGSPLPDMQRANVREPAETYFNQVLWRAGLLQFTRHEQAQRGFLSAAPAPAYLGIPNILRSIEAGSSPAVAQENERGVFFTALELAVRSSSDSSALLARLRRAAHYHPDSLLVPTLARPLVPGRSSGYLRYQVQHWLLDKQLREHPNPAYVAPAAADFPGAVPAATARVSTELMVPVRVGSNGDWEPGPGYAWPHGTGLYVPPGEKVVVYLAGRDSLRHLGARIGVHHDDVTGLPQVTREAFDLTRDFELTHGRTEIYSPYGGMLLLTVPDTSVLKMLRVKVVGAVRAPFFELGKTSVDEWQRTIRQYPAPWAELVSNSVSLTVPAARIRTLADPGPVLAFWDAVLATDARLAALPPARRHPERIIVDRDVAYGYMFTSEKKIVVPDDKEGCQQMLDADFMRKNGSWGHFHELGHRHQFWGLDFEGLGEVSVNLYTMYVFDKLLHKGLYNHPQIPSRAAVADKVTRYLANAPSFEKWQHDPFLALCTYIQLIDAFGWAPIEQVYRQYRQLPRSQYPATEAARRDYWFAAISAATRRNLAPFFAQWQVPVSAAAAQAGAAYPTWLPSEMQKK